MKAFVSFGSVFHKMYEDHSNLKDIKELDGMIYVDGAKDSIYMVNEEFHQYLTETYDISWIVEDLPTQAETAQKYIPEGTTWIPSVSFSWGVENCVKDKCPEPQPILMIVNYNYPTLASSLKALRKQGYFICCIVIYSYDGVIQQDLDFMRTFERNATIVEQMRAQQNQPETDLYDDDEFMIAY